MNILLISQCHKNALKETRRILDQFAERCGERTWQTPITQAGLTTLRKLLRQTARKNTAVACYWTHGKNHTELLWVVGDRRQFNEQGRVPTNRTQRDILRAEDENGWRYAHSIQIMATLAALLHDIGKATQGFQHKLKQPSIPASDPYRHEWISLRLFQAMIHGCQSDTEWLTRLAQWHEYSQAQPDWDSKIINDSHAKVSHDFSSAPPLAQWLMWLIVTHHRLPFYALDYHDARQRQQLQKPNSQHYYAKPINEWYRAYLTPVPGWVCPPSWQTDKRHPQPQQFWQFPPVPFDSADTADSAVNPPLDKPAIRHAMDSATWQKTMSRWANKALNHPPLMALSQAATPIADPLLLHLSRLCLMVGDHNYSSLKPDDAKRIPADQSFGLYANTDKVSGSLKQTLDEHLCGVGRFTARFARLLPQLPQELPTIDSRHKPFTQRTAVPRFQWQNHAHDLAGSVREASRQQGFFGVNMASTGCGKTLGNARIMHALADPKRGLRLTVALGLRVLTLQTGQALREKLKLDEDSLAVLVGGAANRTLFELNQTKQSQSEAEAPDFGSESAQALLDDMDSVDGMDHLREGGVEADEFGTVIADTKAKQLLYAPMVSCTIDHLMQASECLRGGKHIAPMLRLLSSDLILDEPDDFNQDDLPALARLVHWAGLLGSRVLLSSATLTPDFVSGLMQAYQAGRAIWAQHQGLPETPLLCAWFDEHTQQQHSCADAAQFEQQHEQFVRQRAAQLAAAPVRRQADIWPLKLPKAPEGQKLHFAALAAEIVQAAHTLHSAHGEISPHDGKKISVGLVRLANIAAINALAPALLACESVPADTRIHLCCYHARQLLLLRSRLENTLDRILDRTQPEALFRQPEISAATADSVEHNHIFIVLASPVIDTGRDLCADWAIIEPSSMRAIIQLCGRVWRHRPHKTAEQANVLILDSNLRSLRQPNLNLGKPTFIYPGFESSDFLLRSHRSAELITPEQRTHINAIPRIIKPEMLEPKKLQRLADLEHAVMANLLNPAAPNFLSAYWQTNNANRACVHSQRITPFRAGQRHTDYICLPADNDWGFVFKQADNAWAHPYDDDAGKANIRHHTLPVSTGQIQPWLVSDLHHALTELSEQLQEQRDAPDLTHTALRFATVSLPDNQQPTAGWQFNEWLGFGDFK